MDARRVVGSVRRSGPRLLLAALSLVSAGMSVFGVEEAQTRGAPAPVDPPVSAWRLQGPFDLEPGAPFDWPLSPVPRVGQPFQPPTRPYGRGHRGADLVGVPAQSVLAAGAGRVVYAAPLADRGVVSVDHPDGLRTTYEPVRAVVRPGQLVRRGEVLGTLEAGHRRCPGAACLHWGLRRDRAYLDPLLLVRRGRVRLLPSVTAPPTG